MLKIDAKLLDLFTRFSHWFQRMTGKTNFFLAKFGVALCFLEVVVHILNFYFPILSRKSTAFGVVMALLVALILTVQMVKLDYADHDLIFSSERVEDPTFWILSNGSTSWRLVWFLWFVWDVFMAFKEVPKSSSPFFEAISWSFAAGTVVFSYFAAVTPLPPGKSKIREWLEGFNLFLKPAQENN